MIHIKGHNVLFTKKAHYKENTQCDLSLKVLTLYLSIYVFISSHEQRKIIIRTLRKMTVVFKILCILKCICMYI